MSLSTRPFQTKIDEILDEIGKNNLLDPTSPMQMFCTELAKAKAVDKSQSTALAKVINVAERHGKFKLKMSIDFPANWEDILNIYPMLRMVQERYYDTDLGTKRSNIVVDYVNLVDRDRASNNEAIEESLEKGAIVNVIN